MVDRDLPREERLSRTFVALADTLVTGFDVVDLLDDLVQNSVDLFGVAAAGLMLVDPGGNLRVMASSDDQMRLLELLQIQNDEGPSLDCCRSGVAQSVPRLLLEAARWPRFVAEAAVLGFTAAYTVPLRLRDETLGAFNLFDGPDHVLLAADLQMVQALADVATIGLLQHRAIQRSEELAEQLQVALNSRVVIEQAKGVLAERAQLDIAETFEMMRRYARGHNLRLEAVARAIVTGELRELDDPPAAGPASG
jgi:GAF domain-containing protein